MDELIVFDEFRYNVSIVFLNSGDSVGTLGTLAILETEDHKIFSGFAKFYPDDKWDEKVGARIAFGRAVNARIQDFDANCNPIYYRNRYGGFQRLIWQEFVSKVLNTL